jgi:hypothetical protein
MLAVHQCKAKIGLLELALQLLGVVGAHRRHDNGRASAAAAASALGGNGSCSNGCKGVASVRVLVRQQQQE